MPPSVAVNVLLRAHQREVDKRSTVGVYKLGGVAIASRASRNVGLKNRRELDYNMWISVSSALMTRSSLIWQLAFPKGLGAAAGRPRVAPSTPVIFDVQLLYILNVSFSIGE